MSRMVGCSVPWSMQIVYRLVGGIVVLVERLIGRGWRVHCLRGGSRGQVHWVGSSVLRRIGLR
jgi:hypothetical protein